MKDDRNQLFREYVRLLRGLQPKVFVMENVSGMVKGKMKLIFAEVMRELKASGYQVSCRLLNAMYFNVPQFRQRLIFIGVRNSLGRQPSHPKANRIVSNNGLLPTEFEELRFLSWRNKAGTSDFLRKVGQHPTSIIGGGIVFEGRKLLRDPRYVKPFQSFPRTFQFIGSIEQQLKQIGNSVPPLFMQSIARHIREQVLTPERK